MGNKEKKLVKVSKYHRTNIIVLFFVIFVLFVAAGVLYLAFENYRACEFAANVCISLCTGFITGIIIWIFGVERERSIKARKEIGDNLLKEYEEYQKIEFEEIDFKNIQLEILINNPTNLKNQIYDQAIQVNNLSEIATRLSGDINSNEIASEFLGRHRKKLIKIEKELQKLVICGNEIGKHLESVENKSKDLTVNDVVSFQNSLKNISQMFKNYQKDIGKVFQNAFSKLKIEDYDLED